jgi:trehalose 2-sulfotransferase
MNGYIICATPRTGSTLLCKLLASTKVAGDPNSYFMGNMDPGWAEELGYPARDGLSDAEYGAALLQAATVAGRGGTAVFGLRIMRKDLDALSALIGAVFPGRASDKDRLRAAFGEVLYVHLAREDKLAQAVSLVKAEQTGLWHVAPDGSELERLAPPREAEYDFERIARQLAELNAYDAAWGTWFDAQGIEPLRIGYESLSADPAAALVRVCEALGVPAPAPGAVKPGVAKLADTVSVEWMRRYRVEAGAAAV